jgi:outer membrane protein OmpA-like peptidoglycan-associated protein
MSPAILRAVFGSCLTLGLVDLAWLDANAARLRNEESWELLTHPLPAASAKLHPAIVHDEVPRVSTKEVAPAGPTDRPAGPTDRPAGPIARPAEPEEPVSGVIQFERSLAVIPPDQVANLTAIAEAAKNDPRAILRIFGHADRMLWKANRGNNFTLSEDRALAVARALNKLGVPPDRIRRAAFGDTQPVDDRATEEAYRRNRRVEVRIEPTGDR